MPMDSTGYDETAACNCSMCRAGRLRDAKENGTLMTTDTTSTDTQAPAKTLTLQQMYNYGVGKGAAQAGLRSNAAECPVAEATKAVHFAGSPEDVRSRVRVGDGKITYTTGSGWDAPRLPIVADFDVNALVKAIDASPARSDVYGLRAVVSGLQLASIVKAYAIAEGRTLDYSPLETDINTLVPVASITRTTPEPDWKVALREAVEEKIRLRERKMQALYPKLIEGYRATKAAYEAAQSAYEDTDSSDEALGNVMSAFDRALDRYIEALDAAHPDESHSRWSDEIFLDAFDASVKAAAK